MASLQKTKNIKEFLKKKKTCDSWSHWPVRHGLHMDGWLLLVGRLEETNTRGISGNQTTTMRPRHLLPGSYLFPTRSWRCVRAAKLLLTVRRLARTCRKERRRRRRRGVFLRVIAQVTTRTPFEPPNYFITCPVILSFIPSEGQIWCDSCTIRPHARVKPFDWGDWGAVEEERAKWNFRKCPVSLCSSGSSHLSQGRCFSETQVWAQFYFWSHWETLVGFYSLLFFCSILMVLIQCFDCGCLNYILQRISDVLSQSEWQ